MRRALVKKAECRALMRTMNTSKIQARNLEVGMRFVADNRWIKMVQGQIYTVREIKTFGKGREMRWTIRAGGKIMLRAHQTLDVIPESI